MTGFQRARSEQQRELRRQAILDTAARMLEEMPVAEVSLNELARGLPRGLRSGQEAPPWRLRAPVMVAAAIPAASRPTARALAAWLPAGRMGQVQSR